MLLLQSEHITVSSMTSVMIHEPLSYFWNHKPSTSRQSFRVYKASDHDITNSVVHDLNKLKLITFTKFISRLDCEGRIKKLGQSILKIDIAF